MQGTDAFWIGFVYTAGPAAKGGEAGENRNEGLKEEQGGGKWCSTVSA
jgi:hypothetical protein